MGNDMVNSTGKHSACFVSGKNLRMASRLIAWLTSLMLLWPHVSWTVSSEALTAGGVGDLVLPKELGTAERMQASPAGPWVIHIQDLHCNEEVQKNISGIIDYFVRNRGVRLIGLEGAAGRVDTRLLRTLRNESAKQKTCRYLVRSGKINGAEQYAATSGREISLVGVEDPAAYLQERAQLNKFLQAESQGAVLDLRERLQALKFSLYNPKLSAHDRKTARFEQGRETRLAFASYLLHADRTRPAGGEVYPVLAAYVSARQESLPLEVDAQRLSEEMERCEEQVRRSLYANAVERELDEQVRRLDRMEKLLNISISAADLALLQKDRDGHRAQAVIRFIQTHQADTDVSWRTEETALDGYLDEAEQFYRIAHQRSAAFIRNLRASMEAEHQSAAILVTGGFHSEDIKLQLRAAGISCLGIRPRMSRVQENNPYFALLRDRFNPAERVLAGLHSAFALPVLQPSEKPLVTAADAERFASLARQLAQIYNQSSHGTLTVPDNPVDFAASIITEQDSLLRLRTPEGEPETYILIATPADIKKIASSIFKKDPNKKNPIQLASEGAILLQGDIARKVRIELEKQQEKAGNPAEINRLWSEADRLTGESPTGVLEQAQGENLRDALLQEIGDLRLGLSDVDYLSTLNEVYGKALTNEILTVIQSARARGFHQALQAIREDHPDQAAFARGFVFRQGGDEMGIVLDPRLGGQLTFHVLQYMKTEVTLELDRLRIFSFSKEVTPENLFKIKAQTDELGTWLNRELQSLQQTDIDAINLAKIARPVPLPMGRPGHPALRVNLAVDVYKGVQLLVHDNSASKLDARQIQAIFSYIFKKRGYRNPLQPLSVLEKYPGTGTWSNVDSLDVMLHELSSGRVLDISISNSATKASWSDTTGLRELWKQEGSLNPEQLQAWLNLVSHRLSDLLHIVKSGGKKSTLVERKFRAMPAVHQAHAGKEALLENTQTGGEVNRLMQAVRAGEIEVLNDSQLRARFPAWLRDAPDWSLVAARAATEDGPDKMTLLIKGPSSIWALRLEGSYYGEMFLKSVRDGVRDEVSKSVDPKARNFEAKVTEKFNSYVVGEVDGQPLLKFSALNNFLGYLAGDQMIYALVYGVRALEKEISNDFQRQPGRAGIGEFLTAMEAKINQDADNPVREYLTASLASVTRPSVDDPLEFSGALSQLMLRLGIAELGRGKEKIAEYGQEPEALLAKAIEVKRVRAEQKLAAFFADKIKTLTTNRQFDSEGVAAPNSLLYRIASLIFARSENRPERLVAALGIIGLLLEIPVLLFAAGWLTTLGPFVSFSAYLAVLVHTFTAPGAIFAFVMLHILFKAIEMNLRGRQYGVPGIFSDTFAQTLVFAPYFLISLWTGAGWAVAPFAILVHVVYDLNETGVLGGWVKNIPLLNRLVPARRQLNNLIRGFAGAA